jgi:hypothetical protein
MPLTGNVNSPWHCMHVVVICTGLTENGQYGRELGSCSSEASDGKQHVSTATARSCLHCTACKSCMKQPPLCTDYMISTAWFDGRRFMVLSVVVGVGHACSGGFLQVAVNRSCM